ncbi:MAG: AMP-binding protein, partial [Kiloniellales bacterium]
MASIYDTELDKNAANYAPLTPLSFLERAASVFPDKTAVIHGEYRCDYAELYRRCRRLASALRRRGIGVGDTVSVMAPNVPALLEAHYGVLMAGAVLNAINIRLDPPSIAFILSHCGAKLLISDAEFSEGVGQALEGMSDPPAVVDVDDPLRDSAKGGRLLGDIDYEAFLE